jgi:hypothetical protein
MSETTTTFHTAPAGWHAAIYRPGLGDNYPPGWHTEPVIGWLVETTTHDRGQVEAFAQPVVFDSEAGTAATANSEDRWVLCVIAPHQDPTAPPDIDYLVESRTRFLEAQERKRRGLA